MPAAYGAEENVRNACKADAGMLIANPLPKGQVRMTGTDWNEIGTLRNLGGGHDVGTDPLWLLVMTAAQGHEGSLDQMHIEMQSGAIYSADAIEALDLRADRKWG
jgi:hypothetical protein